MSTCPTCRHPHTGLDFTCIGCSCPHVGTCRCSPCRTRAILHDHEAMAELEGRLRDVIAVRSQSDLNQLCDD